MYTNFEPLTLAWGYGRIAVSGAEAPHLLAKVFGLQN
jgi:hypothetical protein